MIPSPNGWNLVRLGPHNGTWEVRGSATLEEAAVSLRRSLSATLPELRAEDLRLALRSLGRITGAVDVEDLLDVIFRDFCIGK